MDFATPAHALLLSALAIASLVVPVVLTYVTVLTHEIDRIEATLTDFQGADLIGHIEEHAGRLREVKTTIEDIEPTLFIVLGASYAGVLVLRGYALKQRQTRLAALPPVALAATLIAFLAEMAVSLQEPCEEASRACVTPAVRLEDDLTTLVAGSPVGSTSAVRRLSCLAVDEGKVFVADGPCAITPGMAYATIGAAGASALLFLLAAFLPDPTPKTPQRKPQTPAIVIDRLFI
tara:strand:+ start:3422 stop:4123 length:702 start_codon:yes stop_codon:yes gene_type:complete